MQSTTKPKSLRLADDYVRNAFTDADFKKHGSENPGCAGGAYTRDSFNKVRLKNLEDRWDALDKIDVSKDPQLAQYVQWSKDTLEDQANLTLAFWDHINGINNKTVNFKSFANQYGKITPKSTLSDYTNFFLYLTRAALEHGVKIDGKKVSAFKFGVAAVFNFEPRLFDAPQRLGCMAAPLTRMA